MPRVVALIRWTVLSLTPSALEVWKAGSGNKTSEDGWGPILAPRARTCVANSGARGLPCGVGHLVCAHPHSKPLPVGLWLLLVTPWLPEGL